MGALPTTRDVLGVLLSELVPGRSGTAHPHVDG
jgi:hypothetical protein